MLRRHWKRRTRVAAPAVVFVAQLRLRSFRQVPDMFRLSASVRQQVSRGDGALRLDLWAVPLRRTFRLRSAWRDHDAMRAFIASAPHATAMSCLGPYLADASFATYQLADGEHYPDWHEARRRLTEAGVHRRAPVVDQAR